MFSMIIFCPGLGWRVLILAVYVFGLILSRMTISAGAPDSFFPISLQRFTFVSFMTTTSSSLR